MKSLSTLKKELIAKAKQNWVSENFGEKEFDKYVGEYDRQYKVSIFPYYWDDKKHIKKFQELKEFYKWLINLDDNKVKQL